MWHFAAFGCDRPVGGGGASGEDCHSTAKLLRRAAVINDDRLTGTRGIVEQRFSAGVYHLRGRIGNCHGPNNRGVIGEAVVAIGRRTTLAHQVLSHAGVIDDACAVQVNAGSGRGGDGVGAGAGD